MKEKVTQIKLRIANLTLLEKILTQNWLKVRTALEESINQLKGIEKEVT